MTVAGQRHDDGMRRPADPDDLALLEEERDFLLRSLDDLEVEREAGNVDDVDYERLRDDYTARAAAVIRSIEAGIDARPQPPPIPRPRRVAWGVGIAGFAVLTAFLLTGTLGERLPGESVTGNDQSREEPGSVESQEPDGVSAADGGERPDLDTLRAAVEADPDDADLRVAYADALLQVGEAAEALREYDAAARLDPDAARPRAYSAMIVFNAGLADEAVERLDEAQRADSGFPDTWFFRGIVLAESGRDPGQASAAFDRYLEMDPDGPYAEDARRVRDALAGGS